MIYFLLNLLFAIFLLTVVLDLEDLWKRTLNRGFQKFMEIRFGTIALIFSYFIYTLIFRKFVSEPFCEELCLMFYFSDPFSTSPFVNFCILFPTLPEDSLNMKR